MAAGWFGKGNRLVGLPTPTLPYFSVDPAVATDISPSGGSFISITPASSYPFLSRCIRSLDESTPRSDALQSRLASTSLSTGQRHILARMSRCTGRSSRRRSKMHCIAGSPSPTSSSTSRLDLRVPTPLEGRWSPSRASVSGLPVPNHPGLDREGIDCLSIGRTAMSACLCPPVRLAIHNPCLPRLHLFRWRR